MLEKNNLFLSGAFHKKVPSCLFVAHHQTYITTGQWKKLMGFRVAETKTQVVFHDSAFPGLRHQRWIRHPQISSAWLKVKRGLRSQFLDGKKRTKYHGVCGAVYQDREKLLKFNNLPTNLVGLSSLQPAKPASWSLVRERGRNLLPLKLPLLSQW